MDDIYHFRFETWWHKQSRYETWWWNVTSVLSCSSESSCGRAYCRCIPHLHRLQRLFEMSGQHCCCCLLGLCGTFFSTASLLFPSVATLSVSEVDVWYICEDQASIESGSTTTSSAPDRYLHVKEKSFRTRDKFHRLLLSLVEDKCYSTLWSVTRSKWWSTRWISKCQHLQLYRWIFALPVPHGMKRTLVAFSPS